MLIVELDDVQPIRNGDGAALRKRLAATPARATGAAIVVLHESLVANHQHPPPFPLFERHHLQDMAWCRENELLYRS